MHLVSGGVRGGIFDMQLNGIVKQALTAAHVPSRLEPTGVLRPDGKRPDGVILAPWRSGCMLAYLGHYMP